ncbi:MAG: NosD domain-containing protein [Candidatus Thorarchaeota archaeon]
MNINNISLFYSFDNPIKDNNFNNKYLHCSGTYFSNETTIIIIGNDGWILASNDNRCIGNGTINNPYIIKDITLTGMGGGYCLRIRDSDVHFIIKNCTFSNASFGIMLIDAYNGKLARNKLYNNSYGIYLQNCYRINISSNFLYSNFEYGISLYGSGNNILNENFVENNLGIGINLDFCNNNTILRNIANFNEDIGVFLSYFSINNSLLGNILNYNEADGIKLRYSSNFNIISENNISNNNMNGICLIKCNYLTISENWINMNKNYGINLEFSNFSTIIRNNLLNNKDCIYEKNCHGNEFKDNYPCYYGEIKEIHIISGFQIYSLIFLFCIFCCILIIKTKIGSKDKSFYIENS